MTDKTPEKMTAYKKLSFTPSEKKKLDGFCKANKIEASALIRDLISKHIDRSKKK